MDFQQHLENNVDDDGEYDVEAAERDLAAELLNDDTARERLASQAAKQARRQWENKTTSETRKQFLNPGLFPELEREVIVPLGGSKAVRLGDMDTPRISRRIIVRTQVHTAEAEAYGTEMRFWTEALNQLSEGQTINDYLDNDDE